MDSTMPQAALRSWLDRCFRVTLALSRFFRATAVLSIIASIGLCACTNELATDGATQLQREQQALTAVYQIDCGGGAVGSFAADQYFTGGNGFSGTNSVSVSGVANAAPALVYQSERFGNHSYTFGSLTPGASYTARLHFAEIYFTSAGSRQFNVVINGVQVLTNFDIYATAGANKALVEDFTTTATSAGQIVIQYVNVVENAKSSGIEILSSGGSSNQAPTVASAAAANPSSVNATTSALSVLGADDGGEANLTYTWATVGTPPGPVTFSANGTNAAKNTTATFSHAGSYTLGATIRDASGATATSNVSVTVNQTLTSVSVTPATAQVAPSATQQFSATARDQFGVALSTSPAFTWTVSGGGTINSSGLFTAGATSGGPFTVTAQTGSTSGTASISVAAASGGTYSTNFDLVEAPISESGAWSHLGNPWTLVDTSGGIAYGTQTGSGGYDDSYAHLSGFSANQSGTGVIHLDSSIDGSCTHEVEILLRMADSANTARGYECNLAYNGAYAEIVRWNGAIGDFTYLARGSVPGGVHDGDTLSASIVGTTITLTVNGTQIAQATDSTFASGNPGIGFWRGGACGRTGDYGFTSYTAKSL
jgi:hypothetical protein